MQVTARCSAAIVTAIKAASNFAYIKMSFPTALLYGYCMVIVWLLYGYCMVKAGEKVGKKWGKGGEFSRYGKCLKMRDKCATLTWQNE